MAKIKNKLTGKIYDVTQKQSVDILTSRFGKSFIEVEGKKSKDEEVEVMEPIEEEKPKQKRKKAKE